MHDIPSLVLFELMRIGPVLIERLLHLRDERRLIRLRHANVPFKPVGLRRVREVRRTHESRGEPAVAMENPRLGMQPRGVLVVRNLHRRIRQPRESLNRKRIRCAHVRSSQHAQRATTRVTVPLDLGTKLLEAAELDERAQKVDGVGAIELTPQVVEQLVTLGVDDQARGMQRPARPLGRLSRSRDDRGESLVLQPQLVIALKHPWRVRAEHREQRFRELESLRRVGLQLLQCHREPVPEQRFQHCADGIANP